MRQPSRRSRSAQNAEPRRPDLRWLVGAAALVLPVAGLAWLLADRETAVLLLVLGVMALPVAFTAALLYYATFILPLDDNIAWSEGFRLLQAYILDRLSGQAGLPDYIPASFGKIGAGVIGSHLTLAIARKNQFTRATEPGYIRLREGETIIEIVDLRLQQRVQTVKAITRDGIPVETRLSVLFQARLGDSDDDDIPYPIDRDAVFRLAYSPSIDDRTNVILWHNRIPRQVAADLVAAISLQDLDTLYQAGGVATANQIRDQLEEDFRQNFRQAFAYQSVDDCPVGFMRFSFGELMPPPEVNEDRIRDWQLQWECLIREEEASGQAQILRQTKDEHRFAQMETTRSLLESLEEIRRNSKTPRELTETVKLHVVEALERVTQEDDGAGGLSNHTLDALNHALLWLQPPGEEPAP